MLGSYLLWYTKFKFTMQVPNFSWVNNFSMSSSNLRLFIFLLVISLQAAPLEESNTKYSFQHRALDLCS